MELEGLSGNPQSWSAWHLSCLLLTNSGTSSHWQYQQEDRSGFLLSLGKKCGWKTWADLRISVRVHYFLPIRVPQSTNFGDHITVKPYNLADSLFIYLFIFAHLIPTLLSPPLPFFTSYPSLLLHFVLSLSLMLPLSLHTSNSMRCLWS